MDARIVLEDAIGYPRRGDETLGTLLIGGSMPVLVGVLLSLAAIGFTLSRVGIAVIPLAIVPAIVLYGYYVRVLRSVMAGRREPPTFGRVRSLVVDGTKALLINVLYAVPAFGLLFGIGVLLLADGAVTNRSLDPSAVPPSAILLASLLAVYGGLFVYIQPIAWANFVRRDRFTAAFHLRTIGRIAVTKEYAVAWVVALIVSAVGGSVATSLYAVFIGFIVGFYLKVVSYYLYGRGVRRATGDERLPSESRPVSIDLVDTASTSVPKMVTREPSRGSDGPRRESPDTTNLQEGTVARPSSTGAVNDMDR